MTLKWWLNAVTILQVTVICFAMDDLVVNVNTRRWLYFVPERFLSMTIDPFTLAFSSPLSQETLNMAKGLSPSFVRLGGIGTRSLVFGDNGGRSNVTVNAETWDSIVRFAKRSGLDVIVSLNPEPRNVDGSWNLKNTRDILKYSNGKSYDVSWQLGYDIQDMNSTGTEIGRDIVTLRSTLDKMSHYRYATVFPPDVSSLSDFKQIQTVKDMLQKSGDDIVSVILQPKFEDNPDNPELQISAMLDVMDNYVWNRDSMRMSRIPKKPFWIAEPKPSDGSFEDAVTLMKRLGAAARLGCQIYLRNPGMVSLKSPTPEFWLALLYKNLVGQGVLETKVLSGSRTDVQMFSHCTPSLPEDKTVLNTGFLYEKGAITVFGVNDSPDNIRVALKTGAKEEEIHVYLLTRGVIMGANKTEITMFNGQQLTLSPTWELPLLSPKISKPPISPTSSTAGTKTTSTTTTTTSQGVVIPGKSIFFLVMPDSHVRTCTVSPVGPPPDVSIAEWSKRLRVTTEDAQNTLDKTTETKEDIVEGEAERQYVSFTRLKRPVKEPRGLKNLGLLETRFKSLAKPIKKKDEIKIDNDDDDEVPVKYIMINENGWLNKLTEKLEAEGLHRQESVERSAETITKNTSVDSLEALASAVKNAVKNPRTKRSSNETPLVKPETEPATSESDTVASCPVVCTAEKEKKLSSEEKPVDDSSEENDKKDEEETDKLLLEVLKAEENDKSGDEVITGATLPPVPVPSEEPPNVNVAPDPDNQKAIEHILSVISTSEDNLLENKTANPESVGKTVEAPVLGPLVELNLKNNYTVLVPVETINNPDNPAVQTLMDKTSPEIPVENVEGSSKAVRQIGGKPTKLTIPIDPPVQAPKVNKPPTAPSPEKIKEMRAKYAEDLKLRLIALRAKMKETREKLQQELKKSIPREESLKNKIRKREEELKDWFRKLDKRETLASADEDPLTLCLDEEPKVDRTNHKRSTAKSNENPVENNPVLFPLNIKTQGIVYNNKIYPAKLFGIVELPGETSDADYTVKYLRNKHDYLDDDYDDLSAEPPRSLKIPRDAYVKDLDPDSPYVPVVILSPGKKDDDVDSKKGEETRVKRSTLSERIAQLKETLFPKDLFESIKREIKPWTRDVRSSRIRRTVGLANGQPPIWWTNELRPLVSSQSQPIVKEVDGEGSSDIGNCEEIGTSKESLLKEGDVIRGGQGESDDSLVRLVIRTMVNKMKSIAGMMRALKEWRPLHQRPYSETHLYEAFTKGVEKCEGLLKCVICFEALKGDVKVKVGF